MSATTKKLPAHGTEARYKGCKTRPACRCPKCTRGNCLAGIRRARARNSGIIARLPRETVLPHIQQLVASGMSHLLVARQAGVAQATISYLVSGRSKTCRREQALRILAVQPGQFDATAERPALGATRRLQALSAIGHDRQAIAQASGLHIATISSLANGRYAKIDGATDAAVRLAYRLLATTPGASDMTRRRAGRLGWAPPIAWADLDDPTCQPDTLETPSGLEQKRDKHRNDEIRHLASYGIPADEIARRVGLARAADVKDRLTEWRQQERKRSQQQVSA